MRFKQFLLEADMPPPGGGMGPPGMGGPPGMPPAGGPPGMGGPPGGMGGMPMGGAGGGGMGGDMGMGGGMGGPQMDPNQDMKQVPVDVKTMDVWQVFKHLLKNSTQPQQKPVLDKKQKSYLMK